jgi:chorismate dehydratase
VRVLKVGAPDYLSVRPLVYGLTRPSRADVELVYRSSGRLADDLERGCLDAALIPSIEYLRGVGAGYIPGVAQVARGRTGSLVLATHRPLEELHRIAVDEHSRTPLAAMRIVLDQVYGVLPDFCVFKSNPATWREHYDGVLFSGDDGIDYCHRSIREDETPHDLGAMWWALHSKPLVVSLWAYNDETLRNTLTEVLRESRDHAICHLSYLADGLSKTSGYGSQFLYEYFTKGWSFDLGNEEEEGLRHFERLACQYHFVQHPRLDGVATV